jgi:hypothetical protein
MHTALLTDFFPAQDARREYIRSGSVTDEQRGAGKKAAQPFGREPLGAPGGVVRSSQVHKNMLLAHALPFASNCSRAVCMGFLTVS